MTGFGSDYLSTAKGYLDAADRAVGVRRELGRAAGFLERRRQSAAPPPASDGTSTALVPTSGAPGGFVERLRADMPRIPDGTGTAVGAAAGVVFGAITGHPILYGIGGASLGRNLPALFDASLRDDALRNMGQTGAAILMARIIPGAPMIGFALGWVLAGLAIWHGDRS